MILPAVIFWKGVPCLVHTAYAVLRAVCSAITRDGATGRHSFVSCQVGVHYSNPISGILWQRECSVGKDNYILWIGEMQIECLLSPDPPFTPPLTKLSCLGFRRAASTSRTAPRVRR